MSWLFFGQNGFSFREADAFCCAENMVLQATELGIASCIISRGSETFLSAEGKNYLRSGKSPKITLRFALLFSVISTANSRTQSQEKQEG